MTKEDLLISKMGFEDKTINDEDYDRIRERNNYYQMLMTANKGPVPLSLNSDGLLKIPSKEVLEQNILNSDKHSSTLILDYTIINREFIYNLLKNYRLFDITEEESKFLLQKYFSNKDLIQNIEDEEIIDLNDKPEISEINDDDDDDDDYDDKDDEIASKKSDTDNELEDLLEQASQDEEDEKEEIGIESNIKEPEKEEKISKKKETIEHENTVSFSNSKTEKEKANKQLSTVNLSTIKSLDMNNFSLRRENILEKNNMNEEKILEIKEIKQSISLFLKNALEKRSSIDKKKTIIQFLHKNNFKVTFNASIFDIKDEYGEYLFQQDIIDEWYNAIEEIEEQQKVTFECSQLLITVFLYGIEWAAKKIGIEELSHICSEVKDPSNLPKYIQDSKNSLSKVIDSNIPNNFVTNILFFIGNVYIKNKVGLNDLL